MRLSSISLQNFRNIELARIGIAGQSLFVHGPNGQGKTNLLEAVGLMTALRSFRTTDSRALVRWKQREARVIYGIETAEGESQLDLRMRPGKRELSLDGNPVSRLSDIIGRFPSVALSSQDIQLLRGSPGGRRRFLDMLLAGANASYFQALRRYTRALKERNSLLKARGSNAELAAFERPLGEAAHAVVAFRGEAVAQLQPLFETTYQGIAETDEAPEIHYRPDLSADTPEAYVELFASQRQRDLILQTTGKGPHRDDLELRLKRHVAREYGSEGQQRGLVLALRLAEAQWLEQATGQVPVILADDILGELDARRREGFWRVLDPRAQVIASGTTLPQTEAGRDWQILQVQNGQFSDIDD